MSQEQNNSSQGKKGEEQHDKKRQRKVVLFLLVIVFFLALGYLLWRFLNRPAIGTIYPGKFSQVDGFDRNKEKKRYDGKYVDFSYPAVYDEKRHEIFVDGPVKESVFLSADESNGRKIAVMVERRETRDFEVSPSVQMRLNEPKKYMKKKFIEGDFQGIIFIKDSQVFEQTVFFFYDGLLVSISVTSAVTMEGLEEQLMDIVRSIKVNR